MLSKQGLLITTALVSSLFFQNASAVPSFARQTGLACSSCHTIFPELNSFGRTFKMNGYTLTGIKQVSAKNSDAASGLQFNEIPPLSAMLVVNVTSVKPDSAVAGTDPGPRTNIALPDELSFFFAGEISPHMGSFIQITMAPAEGPGFAIDNTDIRYANHAGDVTYGVTLNNSPTVQDLWNSTPTWGFPFTAGAGVGAPLIADGLGQNVAGLGAYADWGNGIYTELSLYKDTGAAFDASQTAGGRISGAAPYYRVAWNKNFDSGDYLMVGAYGMQTKLIDGVTYAGPADKYSDNAIDLQYEHNLANSNMISVHTSYTNEKQTLDFSGGGNPTLKSTKLDAIYHWGYHAEAMLGYAGNSGADGAYDDTAYTAQYSYLPWQNTKFTAQYVAYNKIGGSTTNASDANTTTLQAWLMW